MPDIGAAASFYGELFGWTTEAMQTGGGPEYHVIRNGDNITHLRVATFVLTKTPYGT